MKMRNKFLALLLAVSMTCTAAACGSADNNKQDNEKQVTEDTSADHENNAEDDVDVYAAAQEKMNEIKSLNGAMTMEMDANVSMGGETQAIHMVSTVDMSCFYDPLHFKADVNMDAGEAGSTKMTIYAEVADDGTYTMYMGDGTNWQSQSVQMDALKSYDAASNMAAYMQESYHFQDAGTEEVNGKNARKYTGVATGDDMKQLIESSGTLDSLSALGIDASQAEAMFQDLGDLPITLWIDETEYYPVKYEMDMTATINSLMSNMIESLGEEAAGLTMEYTKAHMSMTCSDYNAVSDFSIPDDVKEAAVPAA